MLPDYDLQKIIADQRAEALRAHADQHHAIALVLDRQPPVSGLRRHLLRRVVNVSGQAGRRLIAFSARLDAVNTADDQPLRPSSQVR